jgi:hypothetical protein
MITVTGGAEGSKNSVGRGLTGTKTVFIGLT